MDSEVNITCWHQIKQLRNRRHLAVKAAATMLTMWRVYNARGRNSGNSTSRTATDPEQKTGMPKYREPSTIIHMQFFQLYSVPSVSSRFIVEKHTLIRQAKILVGLHRVNSVFCLSSLKLPLYKLIKWEWGTAVALWLRYCATNRKVAGSIPADVIQSFRSHYGPGVDSASNRNE